MMRAFMRFSAAQVALVALAAWMLTQFVWSDPSVADAIRVTALVAIVVQCLTFLVARLVARDQVIAGWGLGVLLRFVALAVWGFLGVRALGLESGPAMLSLVLFFFVTTLVEPLFLQT